MRRCMESSLNGVALIRGTNDVQNSGVHRYDHRRAAGRSRGPWSGPARAARLHVSRSASNGLSDGAGHITIADCQNRRRFSSFVRCATFDAATRDIRRDCRCPVAAAAAAAAVVHVGRSRAPNGSEKDSRPGHSVARSLC